VIVYPAPLVSVIVSAPAAEGVYVNVCGATELFQVKLATDVEPPGTPESTIVTVSLVSRSDGVTVNVVDATATTPDAGPVRV